MSIQPLRGRGVPDPLVFSDGTRVRTPAEWRDRRRPELLELFAREMYARMPGRPARMSFEVVESGTTALGGLAERRQIRIGFDDAKVGPHLDLLVYLPRTPSGGGDGGAPVILGINFWGNHAVHSDPAILITTNWMESGRNPYVDLSSVTNRRATEAGRGVNARQWPIERLLRFLKLHGLARGE